MKEQSTKGTVIVCDLDNCLSDDTWRLEFIGPKLLSDARYDEYHDRAEKDQPNKALLSFLQFWLSFPENRLFFLTARPERIRKQTRSWIDSLGLERSNLFMRDDKNFDPSPKFKVETLRKLAPFTSLKREDIATIIDDRTDVLGEMVAAFSVPTFRFSISGASESQLQLGFERIISEGAKPGADLNYWGHQAAAFLAREGLINLPDSILAKMTIAPEANLKQATERFGPWTEPFVSQPKLYNTSASSKDGIGERVARLLEGGAGTFRERNATYGSNFRMVGPIMEILFPAGVPPELLRHDAFHLFELIIVKLSRFAISNFTHQDSIHDATVYAAMIEAIVQEIQENASE